MGSLRDFASGYYLGKLACFRNIQNGHTYCVNGFRIVACLKDRGAKCNP